MAANLTRHAGITHVFESDVLPDGTPYLVMEFLDGQSLRMRLRKARGGLPQLQVIRFAGSLPTHFGAAHSKKIIHRDIKPENIMLVRDDAVPGGERAKVLDFGIAVVAEDASLSMSSSSNTQIKTSPFASLLGTAIYMAPEQCLESGRAVVDENRRLWARDCDLRIAVRTGPVCRARNGQRHAQAHLRSHRLRCRFCAPMSVLSWSRW